MRVNRVIVIVIEAYTEISLFVFHVLGDDSWVVFFWES